MLFSPSGAGPGGPRARRRRTGPAAIVAGWTGERAHSRCRASTRAGGRERPTEVFERATALRRLAEEHFDVLVVGGGITGAGVALDAASRGLRTALVEKDDFASGTSSKSSKLVHGGLRYLQQREFRLVYENLAERQRLLENAPHLVTPAPVPHPAVRAGRGGVDERGPFLRAPPCGSTT